MNDNDKLILGRAILRNVEKKVIQVKGTGKRKAHTRTIKDTAEPSRKGTSKIEKLPEDIQTEILDMRQSGMSGVEIKANLESSIGALPRPVQDKLVKQGVINDTSYTLKMSAAGVVKWAKGKGVNPVKPDQAKQIKADRVEDKYNITQDSLSDANTQIDKLTAENAELKGDLVDFDRVRKENIRHRDEKRELQNEVAELKHTISELKSQRVENYAEEHTSGDMGDYGFDGADEYERDM